MIRPLLLLLLLALAAGAADNTFAPPLPPPTRTVPTAAMADDACWAPGADRPTLACRRWGINVHFTSASAATMSALANASRVVRMDLRWGWTEPQRGVYDWSRYDEWLKLLAARDLMPYLILDGANPAVNPPSPGCPAGCAPADDATRDRWVAWAVAAMRHFAGRGVVWELMNEPNLRSWTPTPNGTAYAELALALAAAMRAPGSGIAAETLVGPTLAGIDCWAMGRTNETTHCPAYDWLAQVAAAGGTSKRRMNLPSC